MQADSCYDCKWFGCSVENAFILPALMIIYNFIMHAYQVALGLGAFWNPKAKKWVDGRRGLFTRLKQELTGHDHIIWFHCASLGEFEQGRSLIERIKNKYPSYKILLTFFSPSGYEVRKNYEHADFVFYLPADSAANAQRFVDIVRPDMAIFIKYDLWYYYLRQLWRRNIPTYLVSGIFRPGQVYFKWYGSIHRRMLAFIDHFFVQNDLSARLLEKLGLNNITVAGDTRYDRVLEIANSFTPIQKVESFRQNAKTIVAGSTWPADEKLLQEAVVSQSVKIVIAPHVVSEQNVAGIESRFSESTRFSNYNNQSSNTLIIDNIGMLSRIYHYGDICYVGGGFGTGIHNTLEAAVYGRPVIFGKNYQQFAEAVELIERGGGFSIINSEECASLMQKLLSDENFYNNACAASKNLVKEKSGASDKILGWLQAKRLLTS